MDFQEAYSKGNEALKQKNYKEAKKFFETAIELKPNDVYATNKLAMVFKELGDLESAKNLLNGSEGVKNKDLYSNYLLMNA